jgi:hypothetical protein
MTPGGSDGAGVGLGAGGADEGAVETVALDAGLVKGPGLVAPEQPVTMIAIAMAIPTCRRMAQTPSSCCAWLPRTVAELYSALPDGLGWSCA